jgi:sugar lactone lactonase YvrE
MSTDSSRRSLVTRLGWPECPRWHADRLWFSDMYQRTVFAVGLDTGVEQICEVPGIPAGLGWLPDDTLVVVSMRERKLLRLREARLEVHADLTTLVRDEPNDLLVDGIGNCYVSNLGQAFEYLGSDAEPPGVPLLVVSPDGKVRVAADDLVTPNGMAMTSSGRFTVAEPLAFRVSSFEVAPDGLLVKRRLFSQLSPGCMPDGICMDTAGSVWAASPTTREILRLHEDGSVQRMFTWPEEGPTPVACTLGGVDGSQLFVCLADRSAPSHGTEHGERPRDQVLAGRIEVIQVDASRDGWP